MRRELTELRSKMREKNIDVYIIPTTDYHGSEYVNDYFKCREYVSGFTGSAGTLVVSGDFAGLWTDGRYFLQAEEQLRGTGICLMKMGEEGVPDIEGYMNEKFKGMTVGFDGRVTDMRTGQKLEKNFSIVYDIDLAGEIWKDRPAVVPSEIYPVDIKFSGEESCSKFERLRSCMGDADYILISRLEETAWLYNLRGKDIAHTPVFYGFSLVSKSDAVLYVMDEKYCKNGKTDVKPYEKVFSDIGKLRNCTVMIDENTASYSLSRSFDSSVRVIAGKSPVEKMKAVKNSAEIAATKNAHIRDGAAMVNFICRLKENIGKKHITEISAADYLEECRRNRGAYDLSFTTIAGYEEHGAIVHYAATAESNSSMKAEGFLLVDSGGQYEDGTTDITRTIALGPVDDERKKHYTAVLKGNIALASAEFSRKISGAELDMRARKPLNDIGLDFKHGTGHGVGHLLSVHEGPNVISPRGRDSSILPGMITTDEPGVYLAGKYGIRIENELLCKPKGESDSKCCFEVLTYCPFEREAIDKELLTAEEINYINAYHEKVYEKLRSLLDEKTAEWLRNECRPL